MLQIASVEFRLTVQGVKGFRALFSEKANQFEGGALHVVFVSDKLQLLAQQEIAGSALDNSSISHILQTAVMQGATGVILGRFRPESYRPELAIDIDWSRQLAEACEAVDVVLLDHIIIMPASELSFRMRGFLDV